MFRFSFAVYAQCRVRLGAKTGQGNIVPAEMAHPVGRIIHPVERARDMLQLAIGALPDEIVECQVAVACGDVEDIGGQFGDGGRRPRVARLPQQVALFQEQAPANGSERLLT